MQKRDEKMCSKLQRFFCTKLSSNCSSKVENVEIVKHFYDCFLERFKDKSTLKSVENVGINCGKWLNKHKEKKRNVFADILQLKMRINLLCQEQGFTIIRANTFGSNLFSPTLFFLYFT